MRSLAVFACVLFATSLNAQIVEQLDDSASPVQRVVAKVSWARDKSELDMTPEELNTLIASMDDVEVRLDTTRFEGKAARIFLRLPARIRGLRGVDGVRMEWTTEGVFENGSVVPGDRAIIFDGVVGSPLMTDIFDIRLHIDARAVLHGLNFDPIYEIETL